MGLFVGTIGINPLSPLRFSPFMCAWRAISIIYFFLQGSFFVSLSERFYWWTVSKETSLILIPTLKKVFLRAIFGNFVRNKNNNVYDTEYGMVIFPIKNMVRYCT